MRKFIFYLLHFLTTRKIVKLSVQKDLNLKPLIFGVLTKNIWIELIVNALIVEKTL